MNKKLLLISFLSFLSIGLVCFAFGVNFALAVGTDNVSGWAWSSTIGWISFNGANYGVHVCTGDSDSHAGCGAGSDGKMVGYAWSSNIGWIKFDPVGPYPSSPSQAAQVDASGNITGWARACAGAANADCSGGTNLQAGGWDGWIKLSNATIDFTLSPAEFHGYAWGSDVIGWVSFNCAEGGASGGNICGQSNYKVITTYGKPRVSNLSVTPYDQCSPPAKYQFSWTYLGSAGTFDHAQLQIDDKSNFSDCASGSGCEINRTITATSLGIPLGSPAIQDVSLAYHTSYYWRVKVWDSYGRSSDWATGSSFAALDHFYPDIAIAGFSWSSAKPAQDEAVRFANNGKCYGTGNTEAACGWSWTIPGATYVAPSNSTAKEPVVKFNSLGDKSISVRATDPDGLWCEASKSLKVSVKLPKWKEITPF